MLLGKWMRIEGISNRKLAEMVGGISADGVRKLRYGQRGPSVRVAARIVEITSGKVTAADMVPMGAKPGGAPSSGGGARP